MEKNTHKIDELKKKKHKIVDLWPHSFIRTTFRGTRSIGSAAYDRSILPG